MHSPERNCMRRDDSMKNAPQSRLRGIVRSCCRKTFTNHPGVIDEASVTTGRSWTARNHDLLANHGANLNLNFLLDRVRNANRVGFDLVFVHTVADRHLVRFFTRLWNTNSEVDRAGLGFWNEAANRNLLCPCFRSAELDAIVILLRFRHEVANLDSA